MCPHSNYTQLKNDIETIAICLLVDVKARLFKTIIFEFENMMYLFTISLQKKHFATETFGILPLKKKEQKMFK